MINVYDLICKDNRSVGLNVAIRLSENAYWTSQFNESTKARKSIINNWKSFKLVPSKKNGKPNFKGLLDIHSDDCLSSSHHHVISTKAKNTFEKEFPEQILYLPVEIEGVDQPYWVLWVTTVLDAVNEKQSDITLIAESYKRLGRRVYKDEIIGDICIFRLPMIYGTEGDKVTEKFKTIVGDYGLKGFGFWDKTKNLNQNYVG